MIRRLGRLASVLGLLGLAACSSTPLPPRLPPATPSGDPRLSLSQVDYAALPGWSEAEAAKALPALMRSCERLMKLPADRAVGDNGLGGTVADWLAPCGAARQADARPATARSVFESWFIPHLVSDRGNPEGLFTGYYEPMLTGARTRSERFSVPIHGKPSDLGKREPYYTRAEIEAGALNGKAPVLAWVDDPVDAHILHIQGSGRIQFADGTVLRLSVAGNNGHKFVGIGRVMRERGLLEDISMPSIRAWLRAHPAEARSIMNQNPRYIFYAVNRGEGPIGTEGVPLTPEQSMAVDTRFIPLGLPLWLDTNDPDGRPLRRLVLAQDTGSAIKGVVRGDFFWGAGEQAFQKAGRMKSTGRYYLFLPVRRSPRVAMAGE